MKTIIYLPCQENRADYIANIEATGTICTLEKYDTLLGYGVAFDARHVVCMKDSARVFFLGGESIVVDTTKALLSVRS